MGIQFDFYHCLPPRLLLAQLVSLARPDWHPLPEMHEEKLNMKRAYINIKISQRLSATNVIKM